MSNATKPKHQPDDDTSSAPESGTLRDDTTRNTPDSPYDRPLSQETQRPKRQVQQQLEDDPSIANEER
jgi:hypothetical protein